MINVIAAPAEAPALASAVPGAVVVSPTEAATLSSSPALVWLDGLSASDVTSLDGALAARGRIDIAVSAVRLDGFTDPPLVARCRGLIAGFGHAGLSAAAALLEVP